MIFFSFNERIFGWYNPSPNSSYAEINSLIQLGSTIVSGFNITINLPFASCIPTLLPPQ